MPEMDYDYDPKDALASTDDSIESDHSVGASSSSYLQSRERNPGQQHEAEITDPNALSKRENTANSNSVAGGNNADVKSNPLNYSGGGSSSFFGNARSKIKSKVARKVTSGILAALLGIGGIGLGVTAPSLLAGKIESVLEQRFIAPISKVVNAHSKNLWLCKLSSKCSAKVNGETGVEGESGDGLGQVSDNAKASAEANGSKITEPSGNSDGKIKLSNGDEVGTGSDGTKDVGNLSAADEKSFADVSPSAKGNYGALSGEPTAGMGEELGVAKNIPLAKNVGNDKDGKAETIQEQLDEQNKNGSSPTDLTVNEGEAVSQSDSVSFEKSGSSSDNENEKSSSSGFESPSNSSIKVESSSSIKDRAKEKITALKDEIQSGGTNAVLKFLNVACNIESGTSTALKAYNLGIKLYKIQSLARFAFTFMTVFSAIKADDGSGRAGHNGPTAEQFTQVMNQLTTVMKDNNGTGKITTKSGTDSFGYQVANGDLTSASGKFNLTDSSKSDSHGMPSAFTSTVLANSDSGKRDFLSQFINEFSSSSFFSVLSGNSVLGKIKNGGCGAVVDLMSGVQIDEDASKLKQLAQAAIDPTFFSKAVLVTQMIADATGFISGVLSQVGAKEPADAISWASAITGVGSACAGALTNPIAGGIQCFLSIGSVVLLAKASDIMGWITKYLESEFLVDPMPVGADAMDAIVSGAGASMGINAGLNAVPVAASTSTSSGATSYLKLESQRLAYNQQQDALSRATDSPFDIYNNATFFGSIMGNFVASLYSNGNSPLGFAQSLLGMFGSSVSGILKGSSAYADNASLAYASSCTDPDITSASIAADPFCNPIYGLDNSDTLSLSDTIDRITAAGWGDCAKSDGSVDSSITITDSGSCASAGETWHSAIDSTAPNYDKTYGLNTDAAIPGTATGFAGEAIGNFLNECVTRNKDSKFTPMGSTDTVNDGKDCALTNSSVYGRDNLVTLYNYAEYFLANSNINQGSQLGSQADGSANNN